MDQEHLDKFFTYVDIKGEDECWLWKGRVTQSGYGIFTVDVGKGESREVETIFANHFCFWYFTGKTTTVRYVDNICGNRRCCNPKHLKPRTLEVRLWENTDRPDGDSGCWLYRGYIAHTGYGTITLDKQSILVHRLSWELANNQKVPQGLMVLHSCDVRRCINPDHLRVGTHDENMSDMVRSSRQSKGSDNGNSILTEDKVIEIKKLIKSKMITYQNIAIQFHISRSAIKDIASGRTWNWVDIGKDKMININFLSDRELTEISCKILHTLSDLDQELVAKRVAKYYQKVGFPYYDLSDAEKQDVLDKMLSYDVDKLEQDGDELQQVMTGLNFVNMYHPKMWKVQYKNSKTPMDIFCDINLLTKAIQKRIRMSDTKLQPFNIRKSLKILGGYSVSNFRPTIAKYIYEKFCPQGGSVLDPCCGYGGRLLGAWSSSTVKYYVGVDPDEDQIHGNEMMASYMNAYNDNKAFSSEFINLPFEDASLKQGFDLVFTSPPYFNLEKYSNNDTQSWVRYKKYDLWRDMFLKPLISKSFEYLNVGGYFIINVGSSQLVDDTINLASGLFSSEPKVKWMRLSRVPGSNSDKKFKLEGIYIWKK